jgi:hypothetical protein
LNKQKKQGGDGERGQGAGADLSDEDALEPPEAVDADDFGASKAGIGE